MHVQLARFGFFACNVNGTPAWTHLGWTGYRLILGKRTLRLEFRSVTQGVRRRTLRGTWKKVETYRLPETSRAAAALVRKIARVYLGAVAGVRRSADCSPSAPSSLRSSLITRANVAGGGKVRGSPTRLGTFGYAPARGVTLHTTADGREAETRAALNARRGFLGESGAIK